MTDPDPLLERVRAALRPKYEVERELGRGGMGVVYLAFENGLKRQVAVKVLRPELATAEAEESFDREARNLASVKSPHVIVVHTPPDVADGLIFFAMEYIAGGTLDLRLRTGPMSVKDVYRLGLSLLTGLEDIHKRNLIHRDLKPLNVFPDANGGTIGDFGIARAAFGRTTAGQTNAGTWFYMAPEQRGGAGPTIQTDIYQMGLVLYEACTGRAWMEVPPGTNPWSRVPRRFRRALKGALADDPDQRWRNAAAFKQAWVAGERRVIIGYSALIGLTTLLAIAIALIVRPPPPPPPPPADLAILPLQGTTDPELQSLTRYIQEPFERFRRLRVRRVDVASNFPELLPLREVRGLRSRYYTDGRVHGDTLIEITVNDSTGMLRRIRIPRGGLDVFTWGRAAADSVVHRSFLEQYQDFQALAGCGGSDDKAAIDEYLAGEEAFQRDAYGAAAGHFSRALDIDPDFVLAAWQRALANRWLRSLSWRELRDLEQQSNGCDNTWFYHLLSAQLDTDLTRRLARYRAVIREAPRLSVAWLLYADDMYHRGALIGYPLDSAVAAMEAAIQADTLQDQGPALDHLIWGYVRLGRQAEASDAVARRERLEKQRPDSASRESSVRTRLLHLAYDLRFNPLRGGFKLGWKAQDTDSGTLKAFSEYMHLGTAFDLPQAQWRMGKTLTRSGNTRLRVEGFKAQALALLAMARPTEALAAYDSALHLAPNPLTQLEAAEWVILSPSLGLPAFPTAVREKGGEQLRLLLGDSTLGPRAAWALAMAAYTEGDIAGARGYAARLPNQEGATAGAERLLRLLQAVDSGVAGSPRAALTQTEALLAWDPVIRAGDPFARAILYLNRGRWQKQLGRTSDAARTLVWYENTDIDGWGTGNLQAAHVDAVLSSAARIRRAEVRPPSERDDGCRDLRRVHEVWAGAEPSYAALRDSVTRLTAACP